MARLHAFWSRNIWWGLDDAGRPQPVTPKRRADTIVLRRVDPEQWAALCGAIRARLEPRLVGVGEELAAADLALGDGEDRAEREYLLALDAYAAAGRLFDEADDPADLGGVSALLDIASTHFAVAVARHLRKKSPHRRIRCFYNPLHSAAVSAVDPAHRTKKRQRRPGPGPQVPLCASCRQRLEADLPPDILPTAVSVRTKRRKEVLVAVPYFAVSRDRSIWAATGFASLPGSSDAELVRQVMQGAHRLGKGAVKARRGKERGFGSR
jgi:hypothetical protein